MVTQRERLRETPSVNEVVEALSPAMARFPRALVVGETRRVLEEWRREILAGGEPGPSPAARVERALEDLERPSLRRVINATGVVLHTNLGRAPLGAGAAPGGYSNLEYDLATGRRGRRDAHIDALAERLFGAPAIAVNNNAAAVFLALNELAAGGEAVVSRGELIEIGDGFRIPEIMARSGAALREVGTTNRTAIEDYRSAINERTRVLMRVHPSNFRMEGFTARPELRDLAALGHERGVPVYEDLGSGCPVDLRAFGFNEPLIAASLEAGADLVSFSGDKLLGGPQAGILAGKPELVARLRRNPLFRALRLDKLVYGALEHALRSLLLERWEDLPALAMLRLSPEAVRDRAEAFLASTGLPGTVEAGESLAGGGATPEQSVPTWLIAFSGDARAMERALRRADPPVIARIQDDRLFVDLRTVFPREEAELAAALAGALAKA
jgi:L-seryl-tRNA(Ser) seleniumtransferase